MYKGDPFSELMDALARKKASNPVNARIQAQQDRALCARDGHKYQIHGKSTPTKIECKRCKVTWAVGPRTEPN